MPIIQCDIREGRTETQKRALAREITRVVHETIDAPIEYIYVLIRETPGLNHIKGGIHLPEYQPSPNNENNGEESEFTNQ
jgi:4-oxalocrotonate tautomerase